MNILALDLSLSATGVCMVGGESTVIDPKSKRGVERLAYIRERIGGILDIEKRDGREVQLAVLEGYSFGSHDKGARAIGELGGVVRLLLYYRCLPFVEVPPSNLKRYATGNGAASKDRVIQAAALRAGREFPDNNAADAWWLWQMALAHYCPDHPLLVKVPKTHLDGLAKVAWVEVSP